MPTGSYAPDSLASENVDRDMFLPDGQLLVLAAGILSLWDVREGITTASPVVLASAAANTVTGPSQTPPDPAISVDPALSDEIATTGPDGTTVEIWRTTGWHLVRTIGPLPSSADQVKFSPDGAWLGVMLQDGAVEVFDANDGSEIIATSAPDNGLSPDFSLLGSGYLALTDSDYVYLWHKRNQVARFTPPASTFFDFSGTAANAGQLIIDLIPDGNGGGISRVHAFNLAPQPSQWADAICAVIDRQLTSAELSAPGAGTPDNGC